MLAIPAKLMIQLECTVSPTVLLRKEVLLDEMEMCCYRNRIASYFIIVDVCCLSECGPNEIGLPPALESQEFKSSVLFPIHYSWLQLSVSLPVHSPIFFSIIHFNYYHHLKLKCDLHVRRLILTQRHSGSLKAASCENLSRRDLTMHKFYTYFTKQTITN